MEKKCLRERGSKERREKIEEERRVCGNGTEGEDNKEIEESKIGEKRRRDKGG